MVDLRSLTSKVFVDPSRGEVGGLYAADDLVVFSARLRGVIFVGELNRQGQVKSFRLNSSSQKLALTCRHRKVACAVHLEDHTLVYIWNYDTQQGRSLNINRAALQIPMSNTNEYGLLLQPNTETVMLCQFPSACRPGASRITLIHWRFTFAGECFHCAKHVLEGYDNESELMPGDPILSLDFIPASYDGLYMLQCNAWKILEAPTIRTLQFDERTQAFTSPRHPRLLPVDPWNGGNVVWWKDTFVEAGTMEQIIVHRGTISAPRLDPDMAYNPAEQGLGTRWGRRAGFKDLLINDRYIVRPYCDAFYVFCYDHTVQLPGTGGTLHGVGPWEVIESRFKK